MCVIMLFLLVGIITTCHAQEHVYERVKRSLFQAGEANVPPECVGKNYCTVKGPDYPFVDSSCGPPIERRFPPRARKVSSRESITGGQNDCNITIEYERLYTVKVNQTKYFVYKSAPKNFISMFHLETCNEPLEDCFPDAPAIQTKCIQEYVSWDLWAAPEYDPNGHVKISVDLPACCSCQYKVKK